MADSVNRMRFLAAWLLLSCAALVVGQAGPILRIAGSGTVYPVALKWAQAMGSNYTLVDHSGNYTVCPATALSSIKNSTVCEGGSSTGIKRVCDARSDRGHVHIGTSSRDLTPSDPLLLLDDGYTYECTKSKIRVTSLAVGIDGLAVVTAVKGAAQQCLLTLGGLTTAQVRWIFTDWNDTTLAKHKDGGVDMTSTAPNDNFNGIKEWSDFSEDCDQVPINTYGPGPSSGTGQFFGEQIFCKDCFAKKAGRIPENFPYCNSSVNTKLEGLETDAGIKDFITNPTIRKNNCYHSTSIDDYTKVSRWVSVDTGGIGFFGCAFYFQNAVANTLVRIAADRVKGVKDTPYALITPSTFSIIDGSYAVLTRFLFMLVDNEFFAMLRDLLLFGFSAAGMDLVAEVGYIKINSALRAQMFQRVKTLGNPAADYVPVKPSTCWNGTRLSEVTYLNAFGNPKVRYSCEPCRAGRAKADNLPVDCQTCDEGSFAASEGQTKCEFCDQGTASAVGSSSCTACPLNFFAGLPGQGMCNPCDPGFFTDKSGAIACDRCPLGTFRSANDTKCVSCPAGMTTEFLAATKKEDCQCDEGFFLAKDGTIEGPCMPCPPGLKCRFGSKYDNFVLAATDPSKIVPELPPNFWSDPAEPLSVFACRLDVQACPGGMPGQCTGGLLGRVCSICPDSETQEGNRCKDCGPGMSGAVYVMLVALVLAIVVSYYIGNSQITSNLTIMIAASTLVSMMLTVMQILSMFSSLNVKWPIRISGIFEGLSITVGSGSIPYSCFLSSAAEMRYGFRLALPIVFVGVVTAIFLITQVLALWKRHLAWTINPTLNTAGQLLQAVFISIAAIVVVPFQCYDHPNGSKSLSEFPEVLCFEEGGHSIMLACGSVLGLIFVIPFLIWCVYGSYAVVRGSTKARRLRSRQRFRFMLFRFRTDVWWWGNVLMFRQLLLAFAPSMPSDKAHVQSIYVVTVLTAYGLAQAHFWPWKAAEFNFLDTIMSAGLICVVVTSTSFLPASNDGYTYESLLFVVLVILAISVGALVLRIALHVWKQEGSFGSDNKRLSEQRALELWQQVEMIAANGQTAFVGKTQRMVHYDTKAFVKGIDAYGVVPGRALRLTGVEFVADSSSSGLFDSVRQFSRSGLRSIVAPASGAAPDIKDEEKHAETVEDVKVTWVADALQTV